MEIRTNRLLLRSFLQRDTLNLVSQINDLDVAKWLLVVPHPYTLKDAKWWINNCKEKGKEKPRKSYQFCIVLKKEKTLIGGIGVTNIDIYQGTAEVGYWLGKKHWGKKYGSEALKAIIGFAFKKLHLRRLEAGVFKGNPSSGRLLEKFGFKKEGIKINAKRSKANGEIYDEIMYGLLKGENR